MEGVLAAVQPQFLVLFEETCGEDFSDIKCLLSGLSCFVPSFLNIFCFPKIWELQYIDYINMPCSGYT